MENAIHFDDDASNMQEQTIDVKHMSDRQAMIAKLTHPPTTVKEFAGLPTNDARTQVIVNWRNNDILKQPVGELGDGYPWSEISDYSLVIPTGARIQYFGAFYQKSGGSTISYAQDIANTKVQDNMDFGVWKQTANLYRPIAKSTSLYPNVTAFNNVGTINVQQFNPALLFSGSVEQFSWSHPAEFHDFVRDGIARGTIKTCNTTNVAINPAPIERYFRDAGTKVQGIDLEPGTAVQILNMGAVGYESDSSSIVPSPSQINTNSGRSYASKFIDGAFAVQRLNSISPAWLPATRVYPKPAPDSDDHLYQCYIYTIFAGQTHFVPLQEYHNSKPVPMLDTLWSTDMTWTIIRMQGIMANTPNTPGQTEGNVASPVAIKQYYTMEVQPVWKGPWNGLSRVSPKPDIMGLQMLLDTFYAMPDGMPVKYNSLGAMMPFLASIVPKAIDWFSGLLSRKKEAEAPVDKGRDGSALVESLTKSIGQLLSSKEKYNTTTPNSTGGPTKVRRVRRKKKTTRNVPRPTIVIENSKLKTKRSNAHSNQ